MNFLDYSIIGAYLLGLLCMGFLLKQQNSKADYFLGGRTIGWKPLSLSIMATQLSAVSFISAPAFVGLREGGGLIWLSYELALPLAMLFLLLTLLPYLHRSGVVSVYDYLELRFDRSSRLIISFVFQLSRAFATGIMVYAISVILQGTMGIAHWQSVLLIGGVTIVYSLQGGMKAVVYGDALQMLLIVLGTAACLGFGLYEIGGFDAFWAQVDSQRLSTLNLASNGFDGDGFGLLPMLFGGFVLYAAYYGCDQSEAQRSLAAHDTNDLKKMILAASLLRFPITFLYCSAGLVIGTLVLATPSLQAQIPDGNPDWMIPVFIINHLPNGVIGLLLVAIFAAAMSSVSSAINSLSAVTVEDYCRLSGKALSDERYLSFARITGLFWGVVTLALSFFAGDIAPTIIEAINKVGSIFYGPILACFVLGFWAVKVGARHLNISLGFGVLSNIVLWLFVEQVFWFWWNLSGFVVTVLLSHILAHLDPTADISENAKVVHKSILSKAEITVFVGWFFVIFTVCAALNGLGGGNVIPQKLDDVTSGFTALRASLVYRY
ncbi:sodium/solute symporter [Alteromonas sp. ASW11-36]|uniref:Sodium/solute symporter n=1 Tax=Alteromonas arenosi TaxID=3055817 RepID=A0ABT7SW03_9ALTE|nr:sodium/solute symporter [Alteromonas sp. ASW11-36]MDM7860382.1 sodium/solute symporter [Alteromonas sp. ASW11-36]